MASAADSENSYMLPHGTRPAEAPRAISPASRNAVASHINDIAILPARRPGGSASTSSSRVLVRVAVPPAEPDSAIVALVTSTARTVEPAELSATAPSSSCWPRPAAKDAANPMNDPA